MEARKVLLLNALGLLLIFYIGSSQGKSIEKRSSEQTEALHLERELRRVKRLGEEPALSRTKRGDDDELSRQKRRDMELSRVKRNDLDEDPGLSREKRRDLNGDGLVRVKRDDSSEEGLSRQKRRDFEEQIKLSRVKREEKGLMRMKRLDVDLPELNRVKRGEKDLVRKRRNAAHQSERQNVERKNVDKAEALTKDDPVKKDTAELDVTKSRPTKLETKSSAMMPEPAKRKRGYWERRTRGDYLLHRANKRGKYHKRRYMNKRGRARFMKRKSFLAKQKLHREANKKMSEKDFVRKSLDKTAKGQ